MVEFRQRWSWAAALLPAVLYLALLPRFGRLQYNDYYGIVPQVLDGNRFTPDPVRWLRVKSNEHTVVLPTLLYAANARLLGGDNRGLSGLGILLFASTAAIVASWRPVRGSPQRTLAASALVMTPAAAHSVVLGFSGTIWFLSNALAVAAIALLLRLADRPSAARLAAVLGVGLLGALAYSTNFALWPALIVGALALNLPRRVLVAIAACGGAVTLFALLTYVRPAHHAPPNTSHPVRLAGFLASGFGSVLSPWLWIAAALGCAGIAAVILLAVRTVSASREYRAAAAPWLMLGVYGLINLSGTAVARSSFAGALQSRYASVFALSWVAVGVLAAMPRDGERRSPRALAVLLPALAAASWLAGVPVLRAYLHLAARQPAGELALATGLYDEKALSALTPAPRQALAFRPFLVARSQAPFDRLAAPENAVASPAEALAPVGAAMRAERCDWAGEAWRLEGTWPAAAPRPRTPLLLARDGLPVAVLAAMPCVALPEPLDGATDICWLAYSRAAGIGARLTATSLARGSEARFAALELRGSCLPVDQLEP